MSGVELATATVAAKALARSLLSPKVYDFFSKWKLDTALLDKLEVQLDSVEDLLSDAEEKLIEDNTRVDKWAQKARFAIFDAEDLLDGILADVPGSNKVRTNIIDLVESSNSVKDKFKYKLKGIHPFKKAIEKELSEIIERLEFIAAQKDVRLKKKYDLATYRKGRLSTSLVNVTSTIYGRSEDKEMIIRLINSREGNDDALRVIPIVGLGGIGKTTLAGMVFREFKSEDNNSSNGHVFEVTGWACVSDQFDATRVIKSLLESITGQESKLNNNLELLQQELKIKLQGKRFLIVLDDLWSEKPQEWDALKTSLTFGAIGSRVIVTTRSKKVVNIVCTCSDLFYGIDKLGEDESWSLFESVVYRDGNSSAYPKLKDIGKKIISKCEGLPLAIKMIGGLLVPNGHDENEWRNVLNDKIWENTNIIPSLRLSYFYLPLGVQNCFAYCSIFPKDYSFSIEEVTMLWVGEGLIEKFCEGNRYEDVARAYFTHLSSKFFFQESRSHGLKFVMHDLVHDLALHVSRGLCVDFDRITVQSRRLSYLQGKDEYLLNNVSGIKLCLRTFLPLNQYFGQGFYLKKKLLGELLSNFKFLRVLSLNGYNISTLPKSVGDMKLLRLLDLSCTKIDHLPDMICRLYNLQILLLSHCWYLKTLPAEICNLINLRRLDIDGTNLEEMPDGIGRMTNIRTLSNFVIGRGKNNQMREFKELLHLQGKLHILGLNNVKDTNDVVIAGFKQKEYLEGLALQWEATGDEQDEKVLDAIEAHKNLKSLTIKGYGGKRLSDWIVGVSPSFTAIVSLCITNCVNCEALPSLGNLPFLKDLEMQSLDRLESIGEDFYGNSDTPFQSLEKLTIVGMKALKAWCFPGVNVRVAAFQVLKDLQIRSCPQLTKIPYCFPSLSRLLIESCDSLVKFEMCGEAEEGGSSSITAYRHHPFKSICIGRCPELEEIPSSFANSDKFEIKECKRLVSVPRLWHVRTLELRDVGVSSSSPVEAAVLQECRDGVLEELTIESPLSDLCSAEIHRFTSLKRLELFIPRICWEDEDGEAVTIRLPPNLSILTVCGGMTLLDGHAKIITELSNLKSLTKLKFSECGALDSFPDVELPSTLKSLTLWNWSALRNIPDRFLSGCSKSLQDLRIYHCHNLECLPSTLLTLESLQTLHIYGCHRIHRWASLSSTGHPNYLTNLSDLRVSGCGALECLPDGFHKATTLRSLFMHECPNLCVTEAFGFPTNLRGLHISDCGEMKPFVKAVLPTLTSLTKLHLEGFPDITSLDHCLPESLEFLFIAKFPHLKSVTGVLPNLKHLTHLTVSDCPRVDPKSWS